MKRIFVLFLSVFALMSSEVKAAGVSGSVGVTGGYTKVKKVSQKDFALGTASKAGDIGIAGKGAFAYGLELAIKAFFANYFIGSSLDWKFLNKKANVKMNITPEGVDEAERLILAGGHDNLYTTSGLKDGLAKIKYTSMFIWEVFFGYNFNPMFFAKFGLGWTHLNWKLKKNNIEKLSSWSALTAAEQAGFKTEWGKLSYGDMQKTFSAKKIKKNGFSMSLALGYNINPMWTIEAFARYVTSIKVFDFGVTASLNF